MNIAVIWVHFLADFVFQSRRVAENKSKSLKILFIHCAEYGAFLIPFGIEFAITNTLFHFITDFVTSKLTTHYYLKKNNKMFFVVIGFDQAIHLSCLMLTLPMMEPLWK